MVFCGQNETKFGRGSALIVDGCLTSSTSILLLSLFTDMRFSLKLLLRLVPILLLFSRCGEGDEECRSTKVGFRSTSGFPIKPLSQDFGEELRGLTSCCCCWCWCCSPAKDLTCSCNKPLLRSAWCSCALARRQAMELFLKFRWKSTVKIFIHNS